MAKLYEKKLNRKRYKEEEERKLRVKRKERGEIREASFLGNSYQRSEN